MQTVKIKLREGRAFGTGLRYARQQGGQFDPESKLWVIPLTPQVERMLNAPAAYGWRVVVPPRASRCPHYDPVQGCPLHGETCRG
jgi:hypothetical protein